MFELDVGGHVGVEDTTTKFFSALVVILLESALCLNIDAGVDLIAPLNVVRIEVRAK